VWRRSLAASVGGLFHLDRFAILIEQRQRQGFIKSRMPNVRPQFLGDELLKNFSKSIARSVSASTGDAVLAAFRSA
jgi:hypothetical protein